MRIYGYLTPALAILVGVGGCATKALTPEELTLKQNLGVLRQVIQQFETDNLIHPESLASLVTAGYLRILPYDNVTQSNKTWIEVREAGGGVVGVRSGATGTASDGTLYFDW